MVPFLLNIYPQHNPLVKLLAGERCIGKKHLIHYDRLPEIWVKQVWEFTICQLPTQRCPDPATTYKGGSRNTSTVYSGKAFSEGGLSTHLSLVWPDQLKSLE